VKTTTPRPGRGHAVRRVAVGAGVVGLLTVVVIGVARAAALASSGTAIPTGPGLQPTLASPTAAASHTPAAPPTPSPVVPTGTGVWLINGATVKAGGALATELDTGGNTFSAVVSATKGAWTTKFGVTGQGPVTIDGTMTGPGPNIDATVHAFGYPLRVQGTPGKDLSITLGGSFSSMLVAAVDPLPQLGPPGVRADTPNQTAVGLGQNWLRTALIFTVVGWIALLVAPGLRNRGRESLGVAVWPRLGLGVILALDVPLAMILLLVFGVPLGVWWLGIAGLVIFAALCMVGYAFSGFQLGALVIDRVWDARGSWLVAVPFGLALLGLIALIPYVGPLITLLAVIYGLGSMLYVPRQPVVAEVAAPAAETSALGAATMMAPRKPSVE
jgi:hypothetical protein